MNALSAICMLKVGEVLEKKTLRVIIEETINEALEIAKRMKKEIDCSIEEWERNEIAAYFLNNALDCLEEFNGKRDREEIFNKIFSKFCIGK